MISCAGCAYSLTPERYEQRTGCPFPGDVEDPAITVIVFSAGWFDRHHH